MEARPHKASSPNVLSAGLKKINYTSICTVRERGKHPIKTYLWATTCFRIHPHFPILFFEKKQNGPSQKTGCKRREISFSSHLGKIAFKSYFINLSINKSTEKTPMLYRKLGIPDIRMTKMAIFKTYSRHA